MIKKCAGVVIALALAGCTARTKPPPGYQGVVELDERVLSAEVAGRVLAVAVRRGEEVSEGALVATLDDSLARLGREARAHEVEAARADLALLQAGARREEVGALAAQARAATASEAWLAKSLARTRALRDAGAVPEGELDRVEAELARSSGEHQALEQRLAGARGGARPQELARARARVAAAEAALALEDERLQRYTPRVRARVDLAGAPTDRGRDGGMSDRGDAGPTQAPGSARDAGAPGGLVVLAVHVEPGELAGVGAPLATLADTGHPYVEVFVPQAQLAGVRIGARGSVRVDAAREPFPCVVEDVARSTEFTPRFLFTERERADLVVRVRVRLDDPGRRLHAGVPAFVQIER